MKKKNGWQILVLSILVAIVVFATGYSSYRAVDEMMTEASFENIRNGLKEQTAEFRNRINADASILRTTSLLMASEKTDRELCSIMSGYSFAGSFVAELAVLFPDNTMLDSRCRRIPADPRLKFNDEVRKGNYISNKEDGLFSAEPVLWHATPVYAKNGQIRAMLYGVVPLKTLAEGYNSYLYDGHASAYIIDGNTMDFIVDTWHKKIRNWDDYGDRVTYDGTSYDRTKAQIQAGIPGRLVFRSKTSGDRMLFYHEPLNVNNWAAGLGVEEDFAFKALSLIRTRLFSTVLIIGCVLLIYMLFVIALFASVYGRLIRNNMEDGTTGLANRIAFDDYVNRQGDTVISGAGCVYVDANGLHELNNAQGHVAGDNMLRAIATALRKHFEGQKIFRIGGDEFLVISQGMKREEIESRIQTCVAELSIAGYSIATGVLYSSECHNVSALIREADRVMLDNKREYYRMHDRRQNRKTSPAVVDI